MHFQDIFTKNLCICDDSMTPSAEDEINWKLKKGSSDLISHKLEKAEGGKGDMLSVLLPGILHTGLYKDHGVRLVLFRTSLAQSGIIAIIPNLIHQISCPNMKTLRCAHA